MLAAAGEPRHHGPHRNLGHDGNFLVRKLLEFAQHDHFTQIGSKLGQSVFYDLAVDVRLQARLRLFGIRGDFEQVFVERQSRLVRLVVVEPRVTRVSHDSQQPGPPGVSFKAIEILIRAQIRLLDHVLGILFVAREPASEVIRGVEVGQDDRLEPRELLMF